MKIIPRVIWTVVVLAITSAINFAFNTPATPVAGQIAGRQFEASDQSYLVTQGVFRAISTINWLLGLICLVLLLAIWLKPLRALYALLSASLTAFFILAVLSPPAQAYYDKSDYTENYFILPNESAFFIPDVGDNKTSQTQFGSEAYLNERKIPAKRFEIPHTKLPNSGLWSNYYVPAGRLIVVDRTPVSREWVKAEHRGTSKGDQSFPCQSSEGLDATVGVAIGASVYEENAARFLFRFGVNAPTGDRSTPEVIFTSVYQGKSLAQVMDGPVRSRVQALVCDEISARTLNDDNSQAAQIMADIQKKVSDYMASVGITLDFIGWADTFEFDPAVQAAINRRYIASQDIVIAQTLAPHTATLQALASAEATRTIAGKWNGAVPTSVSLWWLPASISEWFTRASTLAK